MSESVRQLIPELKVAQPQAILTDRAICFFGTTAAPSGITTYQLALDALGIRAAFAAPFNTLLESWLEWYNRHRPYPSLSQGTPARHYQPSRRPAPAHLNSLLAVETSRRVARDATIALRGNRLALPPEYFRQHVWLQLLGHHITICANNQIIAEYSAANL